MKTVFLGRFLALGFGLIGMLVLTMASATAAEDASEEWADPKAILEMGNKRDVSKVKFLRKLKAGKEKHKNSPAVSAQMALAKMGEEQEMNEIVAESRSDDPAVQSEAIEKLRYVANKRAIRELIDLLDHPAKFRRNRSKGSSGKIREGHVIFGPPSHQAMEALGEVVPNPPEYNKDKPTKGDIAKWKEWWKKNRQKFE